MEIKKKEVEQLVHVQKPDTFWTHSQLDKRVIGTSDKNTVKLWQRNMWTTSLYAVFVFSFNEKNELINIETKLNIFGKILFYGAFVLLSIFFTWRVLEMLGHEKNWLYSCLYCCFLILYIFICKIIYESEKRIQRKAIFDALDIEITTEHTINERSLFSFFIRIFTYPLGIMTLYACTVYFFPNEKYIFCILGVVVVCAYFITDFMLFFRKQKK
ncbi:hypothetical protein [Kordia jejudonensis]|uniref:hypothetical protein n=1 Tax=Kordia jejudonensis TaxID=1348245 RepID=UPI0006291037|nr:hypothetical protein [Kordia jejudonensis]